MIDRPTSGQPGRVAAPGSIASDHAPGAIDPLPPVPSEFDQGDLIARYRAAEARVETGAAADPLHGIGFWRMALWLLALIPLAELGQSFRERFARHG